jgi:hypothetical protein
MVVKVRVRVFDAEERRDGGPVSLHAHKGYVELLSCLGSF